MKNESKGSYYLLEKERLTGEIKLRESQLAALEASRLDMPNRLISEALARRNKFTMDNYFRFVRASMRESHIYGLWERILKYFRRFRLITTLLQVLITVVTFLSTSAFYLVFISLSVIALPFIIIGFSFTYFRSLFARKRVVRAIVPKLNQQKIAIIFMPINYSEKSRGGYACRTAKELADKEIEVFIAAPLNTKLKTHSKSDNIHLITQSDYFYYDKKLFNKVKDIIKIHL